MSWMTPVSRRKVFNGAIGVAAGATAATVLTERASPAPAAPVQAAFARRTFAAADLQATAVEQAAIAPAVVMLTDAGTVAVDASLGNDFRLTIRGNRTMSSPSNAAPGQQIIFQITQGPGGPYSLVWADDYEFSDGLPEPTLSGSAGQTDVLGFIYNAGKAKWLLAAYVNGFG